MARSEKQERQDDFAATAESLHEDAVRVAEIETEKQGLDVEDPRVDTLSHEAERLADQIKDKSRVERALGAEGDDAPGPAN
jgi:putative ubiquitin-RnfH superfamily antitoxin RatB of RatAB toxin-antitoxin module